MTGTDLYVTVTRIALLLTPVVLAAWYFDHRHALKQAWREYRQRAADMRRLSRATACRCRGTGVRLDQSSCSYHGGTEPAWWSDPSPRPRRSR